MCNEKSLKLHHYESFAPKHNGTPVSTKNAIDFTIIRKKLSQNNDNYEDETEFINDISRVFDIYCKVKSVSI